MGLTETEKSKVESAGHADLSCAVGVGPFDFELLTFHFPGACMTAVTDRSVGSAWQSLCQEQFGFSSHRHLFVKIDFGIMQWTPLRMSTI